MISASIRRFPHEFPVARRCSGSKRTFARPRISSRQPTPSSAQDQARLGKTLFTRKAAGDPIEILGPSETPTPKPPRWHSRDPAPPRRGPRLGRHRTFIAAIFCRAATRRRDARAHALCPRRRCRLLSAPKSRMYRSCALSTPDDRQADEAFRRVINDPRRGYGAKAMEILEAEASFRKVSLLSVWRRRPSPPRPAQPDSVSRTPSGVGETLIARSPITSPSSRCDWLSCHVPPEQSRDDRGPARGGWRRPASSPAASTPPANCLTTPLSQPADPARTIPPVCA